MPLIDREPTMGSLLFVVPMVENVHNDRWAQQRLKG
jgi:hypothetical protein